MTASFAYLGNLDNDLLKAYSDASLVSLPSRNSAGVNVISLVVDNNKYYPSKNQKDCTFW